MDVFWFWGVNIHLKVAVFFVFGTFSIRKFLFLRFLLKLQISIKWPWHDTRDVCHRVAWKPWSGQTSYRWWSCWLVLWLSSLGERSCRAAWQRSGKMRAKGAGWRRLSKCDSSFVIVVSNGSNVCFFNIPSVLALTQILCGDTLSGPLWSAAASCGCPSTPSTSRRCSATSPAKPWDTQRCEHTCARCRFRSPLVEQSDWDKASVFHASGLCMWTWSACGSLWAWPCFLASPCSPFIKTAILLQTGMWTVRMR